MRQQILPGLFLLLAFQAKAQTVNRNSGIEIEVDPLAYVFHGYSVHFIYRHQQLRYDLGVFGLEQPRFLSGNKNFKAISNGVGLKVNYLFQDLGGFYAGLDIGSGRTKITNSDGDPDTNHDLSAGIHAGYRVFPFRSSSGLFNGLYLTPWVGISYSHFYDHTKFEHYKEEPVGYFATVHIGYKF